MRLGATPRFVFAKSKAKVGNLLFKEKIKAALQAGGYPSVHTKTSFFILSINSGGYPTPLKEASDSVFCTSMGRDRHKGPVSLGGSPFFPNGEGWVAIWVNRNPLSPVSLGSPYFYPSNTTKKRVRAISPSLASLRPFSHHRRRKAARLVGASEVGYFFLITNQKFSSKGRGGSCSYSTSHSNQRPGGNPNKEKDLNNLFYLSLFDSLKPTKGQEKGSYKKTSDYLDPISGAPETEILWEKLNAEFGTKQKITPAVQPSPVTNLPTTGAKIVTQGEAQAVAQGQPLFYRAPSPLGNEVKGHACFKLRNKSEIKESLKYFNDNILGEPKPQGQAHRLVSGGSSIKHWFRPASVPPFNSQEGLAPQGIFSQSSTALNLYTKIGTGYESLKGSHWKQPVASAEHFPEYKSNLKVSDVIYQYLKTFSIFNKRKNGILIKYNQHVGYNFNKKNTLIRGVEAEYGSEVASGFNYLAKVGPKIGSLVNKSLLKKNIIINYYLKGLLLKKKEPQINKEIATEINKLKGVSGLTGYNRSGNNRLIKYSYNLLFYFFKSMYCLISKPVFLFTPDKLTIQLFYFLNIPKFKVFKWYSIFNNRLIRQKWYETSVIFDYDKNI